MLSLNRALDFLYGKGHGLSILIPFRCDDPSDQRHKNWKWLRRYWRAQLPAAEIVVGEDALSADGSTPFSKAAAINNAASRATGDIFVIADADCYIPVSSVLEAAHRIRAARKNGLPLWYVPYRHFYRLNQIASQMVLDSEPENPHMFEHPLGAENIMNASGSPFGHWYGALIQIMPREAFETVGGWDPRFRGWGGEDHSFMHMVDTLYGRHKTLPHHVMHTYHPVLSPGAPSEWADWDHRRWANQTSNQVNKTLARRYIAAIGNIKMMRDIVEEWRNPVVEIVEVEQIPDDASSI